MAIKLKSGVIFRTLDKGNPKQPIEGRHMAITYLKGFFFFFFFFFFFKWLTWPINGSHFPLSPWCTCPSFLLSHFPTVHVPSPSVVSPLSLHRSSTHATRGQRLATDERPPRVSARDELRWCSSWSPKFTPLPLFLAYSGTV